MTDTFIVEIVAYPGLCRLQKLPPGFLDTLIELEPRHFGHLVDYVVGIADIFKHIYNLVRKIHLVHPEPKYLCFIKSSAPRPMTTWQTTSALYASGPMLLGMIP